MLFYPKINPSNVKSLSVPERVEASPGFLGPSILSGEMSVVPEGKIRRDG